MGVQITDIIEGENIEIKDLTGRKIAIDALNVLYQFISIIRQPDGTPLKDSKGRITSHLSGLFYRTTRLIENDVRPCFVFDGKPPEFKATTNLERKQRREEAQGKYEEALERGDIEEARKYAQQAVTVQDHMINEAKELLEGMGIPCIQAPSEGEAQAAFMVKKGDVWGVGSQDFDSLLFGTPILVRNITVTGKRKLPSRHEYVEVKPEILRLSDILNQLKINVQQLIIIGILIGTDYNPGGIKGIGPKTALNLVKEHGNLSSVLKHVKWEFDVKPEQIHKFFLNPPTSDDYSLKWNPPDIEKIKKFLCDEHDFSEKRIDNSLEKLQKEGGVTQTRLDRF